jgi:hypothetical protein
MNQVFGVTGVPVGRCKVIRIWNNQVENDIIGSFGLLKLLLRMSESAFGLMKILYFWHYQPYLLPKW